LKQIFFFRVFGGNLTSLLIEGTSIHREDHHEAEIWNIFFIFSSLKKSWTSKKSVIRAPILLNHQNCVTGFILNCLKSYLFFKVLARCLFPQKH